MNIYMLDVDHLQIATDRLLLKPVSLEDAENIFQEFTPEITRHMFPQPTGNFQDTLDYLHMAIQQKERRETVHFSIFTKDGQEYVGGCGAEDINTPTPELGVWIKKSAHGKKYGREAMVGVKDWIDQHVAYDYIKYPVVKTNIASRKIAEFLGGVVAREFQKTNQKGEPMDEVEYRIYPTA